MESESRYALTKEKYDSLYLGHNQIELELQNFKGKAKKLRLFKTKTLEETA